MIDEISILRLLCRFGWPCLAEPPDNDSIEPQDRAKLKACVMGEADPDLDLLTRCLPRLITGLRGYAGTRDMLDYNVVLEFLKQHLGSGGDCAAKVGSIVCDDWNGHFDVLCGNTLLNGVGNIFSIELDPFLPVLVHRRVIVAQIKSATLR